jgi:hypothetical protein
MEARKLSALKPTQTAERPRLVMPVILRDIPPGYHWGWYSREDQRMHLQTVDRKHQNEYKVWLEEHGKRVIQPVADIPAKVLKRLQAEIAKRRVAIEAEWVHLMIELGWLKLHVDGTQVTLTVYPNSPNQFERTLDLAEHLGPDLAAQLRPEDVALNSEFAVIEIWPDKPETRRPFIQLSPILWAD